MVGESVNDHWHVDARQEWDQVLRDSGLVKTVHVDTSESLSDIFTSSVRLHSFFCPRMHARPRRRSFVVQLQQLHISRPGPDRRTARSGCDGAAVLEGDLIIVRPSEYRSAVTSKLS